MSAVNAFPGAAGSVFLVGAQARCALLETRTHAEGAASRRPCKFSAAVPIRLIFG